MKKFSLLLICLFITVSSISQSFQDEVNLLQSIYGMNKKNVVAEFIELNGNQKEIFWKLYDEYEVKRNEIGKKKFTIIWDYVNDYGKIKAEDAEMMMNESIPLRIKSGQLIDHYYKKIKNKTDPVVAVQFYQIENYLAALIRIKLLEEVFITKE
ncbi:MAG: hypothetical protein L3J34_03110 [Flavobacteriaceae bacterium]|nr:hypothetical protein [Flavobacteriaceae bacterium]